MRTFKYNNVYITDYYSLMGKNENNPTIKNNVDKYIDSYYNNEKTVELAEKSFLIESTKKIISRSKKTIDLIIGGDLQNQILATTLSSKEFDIPLLGLYSACASFVEGLIVGSTMIENAFVNNVIVNVSSHNLVSEKQFRFPIEYGAVRKKVNTFTATGCVSTIVSNKKSNIKIESSTIGKVIDIGYKDVNNMGACMSPSAAEVIYEHLKSLNRKPEYYDLILTGDLGKYGVGILKDYLQKKYSMILNNVLDAGALLFSNESVAGGSGPICLPLILFNKIIKQKYRKILIVGTGSLHTSLSVNLKLSVPSISHAVSLEVMR